MAYQVAELLVRFTPRAGDGPAAKPNELAAAQLLFAIGSLHIYEIYHRYNGQASSLDYGLRDAVRFQHYAF